MATNKELFDDSVGQFVRRRSAATREFHRALTKGDIDTVREMMDQGRYSLSLFLPPSLFALN